MIALVLAACTPPAADPGTTHPGHSPDGRHEEIPGTDDSGDPPDSGDTGDVPDDYADLYTLEKVHTIDITIDQEGVRSLRSEPKEYVEGQVMVDGEEFDHVGVRLKGSGSFVALNGKAAFKLDFNVFNEGGSYHGKGKLTLDNMTQDETQIHEVVAHAAFAAAGLANSRVGYAWVTLNGRDYGLYSNVETPDRDYLERNFGTREGNLYEGGYPYYPDNMNHADFTRAEVGYFQLESGTDVELADVEAVQQALYTKSGNLDAELGALVDLDSYATFQITEAWTGQWDGYAFASNNYRVFVDTEGNGKLYMVASGLDYCFTDYGGKLNKARYPLGSICQADATCATHFDTVRDDTLAKIDAAGLEALMDEAATLTRPYVLEDPRNYIGSEAALDASIEAMRTWIQTRSITVNRWYGGE